MPSVYDSVSKTSNESVTTHDGENHKPQDTVQYMTKTIRTLIFTKVQQKKNFIQVSPPASHICYQ